MQIKPSNSDRILINLCLNLKNFLYQLSVTAVTPTENGKSVEEGVDNKGFSDDVNVVNPEKDSVTVVEKGK